jgi:DNA-binding transcriptional ArsR family regulator
MLALLYLHPHSEYSLTDVARAIGASVKAVHIEATRLITAGLLADRRQGNVRLIRAAVDTPVARPLTDLLAVTYGPQPVLTDLLRNQRGIRRAFIYGSWAARYLGEHGPVPVDVDVLVVGSADRDELHELARDAERILARPVNIHRISAQSWAAENPDAFLATIRRRPLVELQLIGDTGDRP